MFQTFEAPGGPHPTKSRLNALREAMTRGRIDAYLVPRADEYQGEYVPACAERLRWISGFTGSAGLAVVTTRKAAVFVDGRYTVQARSEVDGSAFETCASHGGGNPVADWLVSNLKLGMRVGFDPRLMTVRQYDDLKNRLAKAEIRLVSVSRNLIDRLWGKDRPAPPSAPVIVQPLEFAGRKVAEKLDQVQRGLRDDGHDAVVLTQPDSICWLLNIRGQDVAHNPVVLAFAVVPAKGKVQLFVEAERLSREAARQLKSVADVRPPSELSAHLAKLKENGRPVRVNPTTAAVWFRNRIGRKVCVAGADPCTLPKAIKNDAEIAGSRAAHLRDGVAVTRFLAWLEARAGSSDLDEIEAAKKLEEFRSETNLLREISFDTISGAGPNGAIVHYRVNEASNRRLKRGELYLVDSGAQYQDGTTDITRTVAIGKPTSDMRDRFTRVLKGHISVATARFPKGTRGVDLDPFARRALWDAGLDYDHGTGHGVGSYLSVHEGPASISRAGMVPLEAGMILSNEPGYYKEDGYGIRIENLVLVTPAEVPKGGDRAMLGFETLTLAPIDRRLVDVGLLDEAERAWLDAYHARVLKMMKPHLDKDSRSWLIAACAPL